MSVGADLAVFADEHSTYYGAACAKAPVVIENGLDRLRRDLDSGEWDLRYGHLRTQTTLDVGLRLATAELS